MSGFHLEAGKYAAYLWPAYGVSALAIGALIVESLAAARRWRRRAEGLDKPEDKR